MNKNLFLVVIVWKVINFSWLFEVKNRKLGYMRQESIMSWLDTKQDHPLKMEINEVKSDYPESRFWSQMLHECENDLKIDKTGKSFSRTLAKVFFLDNPKLFNAKNNFLGTWLIQWRLLLYVDLWFYLRNPIPNLDSGEHLEHIWSMPCLQKFTNDLEQGWRTSIKVRAKINYPSRDCPNVNLIKIYISCKFFVPKKISNMP